MGFSPTTSKHRISMSLCAQSTLFVSYSSRVLPSVLVGRCQLAMTMFPFDRPSPSTLTDVGSQLHPRATLSDHFSDTDLLRHVSIEGTNFPRLYLEGDLAKIYSAQQNSFFSRRRLMFYGNNVDINKSSCLARGCPDSNVTCLYCHQH